MLAIVFTLGTALRSGLREDSLFPQTRRVVVLGETSEEKEIHSEVGPFWRKDAVYDKEDPVYGAIKKRTLKSFYRRTAYAGAPPFVPHPVEPDMSVSETKCLSCHQNGGFVPSFNAFSPVTPHPHLINCRQCHVRQMPPMVPHELDEMYEECLMCHSGPADEAVATVTTHEHLTRCRECHVPQLENMFEPTVEEHVWSRQVHINALPGSPPIIPHDFQMRGNCLACHAGPAAVEEVRCRHHERFNCRECHVHMQVSTDWRRP